MIRPSYRSEKFFGCQNWPLDIFTLQRLIEERLAERPAVGQRRRVDERLEGAPGLAAGLDDAVELRVGEVAPADPGEHVAVVGVEHHGGALEIGGAVVGRLGVRRVAGALEGAQISRTRSA